MNATYYDLLGVEPTATSNEIKRAYWKRAKECHPDMVPPHRKAQAEEEFKGIGEAYEVLSNPQKRADYDETNLILRRAPNSRTTEDWASTWENYQRATYGQSRQQTRQDTKTPKQRHEESIQRMMAEKRERVEREARAKAQPVRITAQAAMFGTIATVWLGAQQLSLRIPAGIAEGTLLRVRGEKRNYYFRVVIA